MAAVIAQKGAVKDLGWRAGEDPLEKSNPMYLTPIGKTQAEECGTRRDGVLGSDWVVIGRWELG